MPNSTADFDDIMALAANDSMAGRAARPPKRTYRKYNPPRSNEPKNGLANLGVFLGISVFFSVVFVAGLMPASTESPELWTHAFIALTIAQFAILAGASAKTFARRDRMIDVTATAAQTADAVAVRRLTPPRLPDVPPAPPPVALASGRLNDKVYVAFSDGSVEIETMLGLRRFPDITAAREFVGS